MANRFFLLTLASGDWEGMVGADGPHLKSPEGSSLSVGEIYLGEDFPGHPGCWAFDLRHALPLSTLTAQEQQQLADAFGLPRRANPAAPHPESQFWQSEAFSQLCQWVRHHHTRAQHQVKRHPQRPPYWLAMCEAVIAVEDGDN
ncbi:hypothetical protein [Ferrimonas balearica]|uniref:hypothetical protein n=1 Tax=Ferrimonas balearica TaxID=44012 RepID=UPI001C98B03B|nr:hypothetical protein [Ferrimonas balearica]MBY5979683.1 hypothetical protein [Ferrimonas balearica]